MNNFEIELRYEVLDPSQLPSFVAPFKLLHQKCDIDVYLDNPSALLYQKGIFIRVRNGKKLDIKFNRACLESPDLAIQDYCEEYNFALPLQEADLEKLNSLLVSLDLQPVPTADFELLKSINNLGTHYFVDKNRASYQCEAFTLCIDTVADLGTYLEMELEADSLDNLAATKQKMQHLLARLSLAPLKTGYGTLLLRKNNFKHYLLGRFILDEDRKYAPANSYDRL